MRAKYLGILMESTFPHTAYHSPKGLAWVLMTHMYIPGQFNHNPVAEQRADTSFRSNTELRQNRYHGGSCKSEEDDGKSNAEQ